MICPQCDCHHDGPELHCHDCLQDLARMLESRDIAVITVVTEWMQCHLVKPERPDEIECPKCMHEFEI
jgi:hypothetical protein